MKLSKLGVLSIALRLIIHPVAATAQTLPAASGGETIYDVS